MGLDLVLFGHISLVSLFARLVFCLDMTRVLLVSVIIV
jgi:hypothetical protein